MAVNSSPIGLRNITVFKIENDDKTTTYATGVQLAPAIKATLTPRTSEATQYGDDRTVETISNLQGYDLTFEVTDFDNEQLALLFNYQHDKSKDLLSFGTNNDVPYFGVAFETPLANGGVRGEFLAKVKFSANTSEYNTQGENIEFQTSTITAKSISRNSDGITRKRTGKVDAEWYKATTHNVAAKLV